MGFRPVSGISPRGREPRGDRRVVGGPPGSSDRTNQPGGKLSLRGGLVDEFITKHHRDRRTIVSQPLAVGPKAEVRVLKIWRHVATDLNFFCDGSFQGVVSTGRRNIRFRSFCWGFQFRSFTWRFVELTHRFV
jgi:hypothetical protein